jgi:hypothetical protein
MTILLRIKCFSQQAFHLPISPSFFLKVMKETVALLGLTGLTSPRYLACSVPEGARGEKLLTEIEGSFELRAGVLVGKPDPVSALEVPGLMERAGNQSGEPPTPIRWGMHGWATSRDEMGFVIGGDKGRRRQWEYEVERVRKEEREGRKRGEEKVGGKWGQDEKVGGGKHKSDT